MIDRVVGRQCEFGDFLREDRGMYNTRSVHDGTSIFFDESYVDERWSNLKVGAKLMGPFEEVGEGAPLSLPPLELIVVEQDGKVTTQSASFSLRPRQIQAVVQIAGEQTAVHTIQQIVAPPFVRHLRE